MRVGLFAVPLLVMGAQEAVFINTRARLQRLNDAKFFAGWVKEFSRTDLVVRCAEPVTVAPTDVFMVQVHGHTSTALFKAVLSHQFEVELFLTIPEPVRFLTAHEAVRVSVDGLTALLTSKGRAVEAEVVDLSVKGAGLLTTCEFTKGEKVTIAFSTPLGPVECTGVIRYAKPDPAEDDKYRIGLELDDLGRIERARWQRLIEQDAA